MLRVGVIEDFAFEWLSIKVLFLEQETREASITTQIKSRVERLSSDLRFRRIMNESLPKNSGFDKNRTNLGE